MASAGGGRMTPPDLLLFEAFGGDWKAYEVELYRVFLEEIHPRGAGSLGFVLASVQEGRVEDDRMPDLRRCERIRWVRWIIENGATHAEIDEWQNRRGTETNALLWYRQEYLVVLAQRRDYWLLKTAGSFARSATLQLSWRRRPPEMAEAAQANWGGLECSSYTWQVRRHYMSSEKPKCQGKPVHREA
jgi:hypothetical protein